MALSPSFVLTIPRTANRLITITTIMLTFVKAVAALTLTPLFHQVAANPLPNVHAIREQYAPGHLGAVASESSICSNIGIDLLRQGGNAADAVGVEVLQLQRQI